MTKPVLKVERLTTMQQFEQCTKIQAAVWGEDFADRVSQNQINILARVGGICAGAINEADEVVGFVLSFGGYDNEGLLHWSDLMGVMPGYRDGGIGRRLKLKQRELCMADNVTRVEWSFDPLVARNAHFNLNRIGVEIIEYVPRFYESTGSALHRLPLDRHVARWTLDAPRVQRYADGDFGTSEPADAAPVLNDRLQPEIAESAIGDQQLRIEVPLDIIAILESDIDQAISIQEGVRAAFLATLSFGYNVSYFYRDETDNRSYYVLDNKEELS